MTYNCCLSYFEAIFAIISLDLVTPQINLIWIRWKVYEMVITFNFFSIYDIVFPVITFIGSTLISKTSY